MPLPGFSAETSVYRAATAYQTTGAVGRAAGAMYPALAGLPSAYGGESLCSLARIIAESAWCGRALAGGDWCCCTCKGQRGCQNVQNSAACATHCGTSGVASCSTTMTCENERKCVPGNPAGLGRRLL